MAKMSSSADYFLRDSERFCRETSNIVRRNDNEGFAMPNLTRGLRCRNTFKSRLLCSTSEKSQIHEEVHSIGYGVDGIEDFNAPTTSTATCQQKQFSSIMNSFHDRLSSTDIRYNQNECRNRLFRPALQKSAFNSRLEECNQDYNLGKSVDDMSITKKFGLGLRNSTTNTSNIFKDKVSFYHNQNYTSNNDSVASRKFNLEMRSNSLEKGMCNSNPGRFNPDLNVKTSTKATFPRMFGQQSKNVALETFTLLEDSTRSSLVENFRSNSQINMPTTSKTFGSEARKSLFGGGTLICDKKKYNEIQYDNEGFVRPTIPRAIRPRNSIMSSRLFTGNNFGQYNKDLSSASVFNVTHIPRRDLDLYSDSRQFSLRQNSVDSLSIAGSVASIATAKAQFINVLESLHHSILNMAPNLPIEAVRKEFDHAKEMLETISEISCPPTTEEIDAASVASFSSKNKCPTIPENILEGSFSLKSGNDILKGLVSKSSYNKNVPPSMEKEKTSSLPVNANQFSDDEKDDSALVFKKPKPYYRSRKKKISTPKIKTPQQKKNFSSKRSYQIINLKQWYPVAEGSNLTFCGTNENGIVMQTEAVKKRLSNRKVELINGLECNLVGSPSDVIISVFPKTIISQLNDGLMIRWRLFQKQLLTCQAKVNKVMSVKSTEKGNKSSGKSKFDREELEICDTTPKTRRKSMSIKVNKSKKKHISLTPLAKKIKLKLKTNVKKSPSSKEISKKQIRRKSNESKKENRNEVVVEKKKMSPKYKTPRNNNSFSNSKTVESDTRTRSGRAVKPPQFFTVTGKDDVNSSKVKDVQGGSAIKECAKSSEKKFESPRVAVSKKQSSRETENSVQVHCSKKNAAKDEFKCQKSKRKREIGGDVDSVQRKKSKSEISIESANESRVENSKKSVKKSKVSKSKSNRNVSPRAKKKKFQLSKINENTNKKTNILKNGEVVNSVKEGFEGDFELQLDDIEIPEITNVSCKLKLNRSQLRLVSMETPPLKYFNSNLKLLKSCSTPVQSPNWCISQRTESEVKQFQRRRALARKRKSVIEKQKTVSKGKNLPKSKDLKNVLDWVSEKAIRSPVGGSQIVRYMIPSRKQTEFESEEEDDGDDYNNHFED